MFKKIMLTAVCGLCAVQSTFALTQAQEHTGKNFDHGSDYEECLDNCREYHRDNLKWHRGKGKGMCWNECQKAHPRNNS